MVKPKLRILNNSVTTKGGRWIWTFPVLAALTFIASWGGVFPATAVEQWYARPIFPVISALAEEIADAVSFSWLDVAIPVGVVLLVFLIGRRKWKLLLNLIGICYLIFFWSWALNYHREPLASKLELDSARTKPAAMEMFTMQAAAEINRLYAETRELRYNEAATRQEASSRVRHVVYVIDGRDWTAAHRIKISWIGDLWFHAAGIDGMFNPAGQEPIISNTLLDIERPFVMCHELAHVRGYPDEGDANVIAALSTLMSGNPAFQYSGWLNLWLYLRNRDFDKLLDPGPRADLLRIFNRARTEQIRWINNVQTIMLDWFLKANDVEQGIRSYSRVVVLTAASEPYWDRFR